MFTIENKEFSVIKITIISSFTEDDLNKILGILSRIFETKKQFSFFVEMKIKSNPSSSVIASMTKTLVSWMKSNRENIIKYLNGSAIIIKSEAFAKIINGVFAIHPTIKPNLITTDNEKGEEFVTNIMKEILKKDKTLVKHQ